MTEQWRFEGVEPRDRVPSLSSRGSRMRPAEPNRLGQPNLLNPEEGLRSLWSEFESLLGNHASWNRHNSGDSPTMDSLTYESCSPLAMV